MLPWSCMATTRSTNAAKPVLSCVDLFACSVETFNNLAIFIQGWSPVSMDFSTSQKHLLYLYLSISTHLVKILEFMLFAALFFKLLATIVLLCLGGSYFFFNELRIRDEISGIKCSRYFRNWPVGSCSPLKCCKFI